MSFACIFTVKKNALSGVEEEVRLYHSNIKVALEKLAPSTKGHPERGLRKGIKKNGQPQKDNKNLQSQNCMSKNMKGFMISS